MLRPVHGVYPQTDADMVLFMLDRGMGIQTNATHEQYNNNTVRVVRASNA